MATAAAPARAIDSDKLNTFIHQAVVDMGAALHGAIVLVGDKLGLYRALSDGEATTARALSERTGTSERYIREWLNASAASHYVEYDPATDTYSMPPEQAFVLSPGNGMDVPGFYHMISSCMKDEEKLTETIRTGKGFGWHEHEKGLFVGCERFFRPNYLANLLTSWIPSLEGVEEKLRAGALVADIGCGHGASTILMAKAFPRSRFRGFDYHGASIEEARAAAAREGLSDRVTFETAEAKSYPGDNYDFAACFDCLHDMGDPAGAARHVKESLTPQGTWMVVEPQAGDDLAANFNTVGRVFYSASTLLCVPASLSQEGALGLGAQAGEKRLRSVIEQGGFTHVRRAAETPFNLVLEARA